MGHKRHEGPEVPTVTIHRPCWLLSITHACCQEPVQAEETGRTNKDRRDLNNRATAHYYPSPLCAGTKERPVQAKKRVKQTRNRCDFNNRAVARHYPSPFSQVRKKENEQQHRFLSLLRSSQHRLLPGILFCFTFVKQRQLEQLPQFFLAWLASFGVRVIHCALDAAQNQGWSTLYGV